VNSSSRGGAGARKWPPDLVDAQRALSEAIGTGETDAIKHAIHGISSALLRYERVPESLLDFLVDTVFSPEVRRMHGSLRLLMLLESIWRKLLPERRERWLVASERHFGSFADRQASWVIVELIGDHFQNRRGLRALNQLRWASDDDARALVPHGYMHLAAESDDENLAIEALEMVLSMIDDPSPRVREAVASARAQAERLDFEVLTEDAEHIVGEATTARRWRRAD
jgi:hypothetical protein